MVTTRHIKRVQYEWGSSGSYWHYQYQECLWKFDYQDNKRIVASKSPHVAIADFWTSPILRGTRETAPSNLDHLSEKCWRAFPRFHQLSDAIIGPKNCPVSNLTQLPHFEVGHHKMYHFSSHTYSSWKHVSYQNNASFFSPKTVRQCNDIDHIVFLKKIFAYYALFVRL